MEPEEFDDMLQTIKFVEEEAKEKYEMRMEHFDAIHDRIISNLQTLCREKMLIKDWVFTQSFIVFLYRMGKVGGRSRNQPCFYFIVTLIVSAINIAPTLRNYP